MIRVLIADDFADTRTVLRASLETSPEIRVCGEATCGDEAVDKAQELKPDVVVLDLRMPEGNGVDAASKISAVLPNTPIALMSIYPELAGDRVAAGVGVSKFFCKTDLGGIRSWIETLQQPPAPDSASDAAEPAPEPTAFVRPASSGSE